MIRAVTVSLLLAIFGNGVFADGKTIYQRCASCHLADGAGIPAVFPPLKDRAQSFSASKAGRVFLIMTVTGGLMGSIDVEGSSYMGVMPAQNLSSAETADVLNYVSYSLVSNKPDKVNLFTEQEVTAVRADNPGANGHSVAALRKQVNSL